MAHPPTVDREERTRRLKAFWGQLLLGLVLGVMASALIWLEAWKTVGFTAVVFMIIGLPMLKIGFAVYFLVRRHRGMGVGLLLSLPIGFIMFADRFLSSCARILSTGR